MKGHEGSVKSLAFLPSKRVFYSSGADGKILRWDLDRSGARPQVLINNNFSNRSLAISSNGRWLACGTGTSSIQVFNLNQSNSEPELLQGHQGSVVDLDFIDGKDILISMGSDKSLISWNLLTGKSEKIVTHSSRIRVISVSKDGRYVYGGTDDGKLIRWTISNGESRMIYDNRNTSINTLALNRNGSRVVLGDKSGNIIVLDPNAGRVISRVKGHSSRVLDISYSPDNTQLASSSMDGTIKIWNARDLSETPIVLTAHESWVFAIAFSPDGRSIVSSSENGDIFFWSSRTKYLADEMCNVISRNFTDQEWDIYVGMDVDYQKTCVNK
jgi:WD40 repeat protein